jgi:nitrite reductase/ring-hydroxylating ferredoxin subunit
VADVNDLYTRAGGACACSRDRPALFNVNGTYHAMGAIYPHEDGSLHEGEVDGVTIICPWHRYDFTVKTGECSMDSDLQVPTSVVMTEDNDILLEVT